MKDVSQEVPNTREKHYGGEWSPGDESAYCDKCGANYWPSSRPVEPEPAVSYNINSSYVTDDSIKNNQDIILRQSPMDEYQYLLNMKNKKYKDII